MLFNSRWLLLPEIHTNPLLSCFLTFQDKPPLTKKILNQDNYTKAYNFYNTAWLKQKLVTGFGLWLPILKHLIWSYPLNMPKRNRSPVMKQHENWCWNPSFQTRVTNCPCSPLTLRLQPHVPTQTWQTATVCRHIPDSWVSDFFYYTQTASFFIPINKNIISLWP